MTEKCNALAKDKTEAMISMMRRKEVTAQIRKGSQIITSRPERKKERSQLPWTNDRC